MRRLDSSNTPPKSHSKHGFALVIALGLMAFVVLLLISMTTLVSVETQNADRTLDQLLAKQNAMLGITIGIGELQKHAGPDRRVSARADILAASVPNPHWTGIWASDATSGPSWLVSSPNDDDPDPTDNLDETNSVILHIPASDAVGSAARETRAPQVDLTQAGPRGGSFAWWVADEGAKARVDLAPTENADDALTTERRILSASPQATAIHHINAGDFDPDLFDREGSVERSRLVSGASTAVVTGDAALPKEYFHDITTGGFGLPVNVKEGRLKTDLSLVFDRSQTDSRLFAEIIGARTSADFKRSRKYYRFSSIDSDTFYLSEEIASNVASGVGPNWGILFNYARLWEGFGTDGIATIPVNEPADTTNIRLDNWSPYVDSDQGNYSRDVQHTAVSVAPVLSMVQVGFFLDAVPVAPDPLNPGISRSRLRLRVQPMIGLWNPYDVALTLGNINAELSIAPFLQINYRDPSDPSAATETVDIWLREYWNLGSNALPTDQGTGGKHFRMTAVDADFQPGEFRLFAIDGQGSLVTNNFIRPTFDPEGGFFIDLKTNGPNSPNIEINDGSEVWAEKLFIQDTQWGPTTSSKFTSLNASATSAWLALKLNGTLSRYANLWNGDQSPGDANPNPETVENGARFQIENLSSSPEQLGTWRWTLRNSAEAGVAQADQSLRGWVDSNPTALVTNVRWDGSKKTGSGVEGWYAASPLIGGSDGAFSSPFRGLVAQGGENNMPPSVPVSGRWQGLGGPSANGYTHAIINSIPRAPLSSIGQFQHAPLARYQFEPGFVVGNSYANPRIPLDEIVNENFAADTGPGFDLVDISHQVNERLWDEYFFSTLSPDYLGENTSNFDSVFPFEDLVSGVRPLPNPRMVFIPLPQDSSLDAIISEAGTEAAKAVAARIGVSGAFNVNSTSVAAWKAVLASMAFSELPTLNRETGAITWQHTDGIHFNRFAAPISDVPSDGSRTEAFWEGWRELSDNELEELAEAIVAEVRARGPFLSLADFVNRDPGSSTLAHQRKGALQAALDETLNNPLPSDVGLPASNPIGNQFSDAIDGESQAAGHAAYLLQGDVLQSLAPILQVRSDYFRIRVYGDVKDTSGDITARAWGEAFVQRTAPYAEATPADTPEQSFDDLSELNKRFGRQFQIVGFRWLSEDEI